MTSSWITVTPGERRSLLTQSPPGPGAAPPRSAPSGGESREFQEFRARSRKAHLHPIVNRPSPEPGDRSTPSLHHAEPPTCAQPKDRAPATFHTHGRLRPLGLHAKIRPWASWGARRLLRNRPGRLSTQMTRPWAANSCTTRALAPSARSRCGGGLRGRRARECARGGAATAWFPNRPASARGQGARSPGRGTAG
jgi:hypothetical protein